MAKTMSLVDIIYEIKKEELKKSEPEKKALPSSAEEPSSAVEPEPVKEAPPVVEEEPIVIVKIKDFWSRLTHDSDTD
jgi:hypothetical protein